MTTSTGASKSVTIFEGPDGGGKSTIAQEYATRHNAVYIHHGPYKQVGDGLARMFLESMLPALMGYQDVVLDRCWLSEPIYADAFREGNDRVGPERSRILDRIALRAGAVVVRCLPPWESVKATFNGRKDDEYLDDDSQLSRVYNQYDLGMGTSLPVVCYDYTQHKGESLASISYGLEQRVEPMRVGKLHPLRLASTGDWGAQVIIVGEDFGDHKNNDAMYQTPFGSFNGMGCSLWLSQQLTQAGVSERDLLWINADELERHPEFVKDWHPNKRLVALGSRAEQVIMKLQPARARVTVNHPQYWKRFQARAEYPLIKYLKDLRNATT